MEPYTMPTEDVFDIFDENEKLDGSPIGFVHERTPLYFFIRPELVEHYVPNRINEKYDFEKN